MQAARFLVCPRWQTGQKSEWSNPLSAYSGLGSRGVSRACVRISNQWLQRLPRWDVGAIAPPSWRRVFACRRVSWMQAAPHLTPVSWMHAAPHLTLTLADDALPPLPRRLLSS
ncbi:hypothetical protein T484DRAFT_1925418 [Baffinella frigidus]|nr:hypothetical protein T484DRAFT_1925418 [Cryptophyta sp. CCMP2293]